MKFHQRSQRGPESLSLLFAVLLIVVSFILQTRTAEAQGNQQPGVPPAQQPTPSQHQGKIVAPFPRIEEAQIKDFDSLPKEAQEARLAAKGPLFPQKYSMSNFSMRAFVKGGSPLVIDYALQPNSTALLTISVEGVEPYTLVLTESTAGGSLPPGNTLKGIAGALLMAILDEFLKYPERARNHLTAHLPEAFGERPQVGKLSIQAFTNGPGEVTLAHFRLYGLGIGNKALGSTASINRDASEMSNHFNPYRLAPGYEGETTMAIDQITLTPWRIRTSQRQKVKFRIHSRSAFPKLAALFYREVRGDHESFTEQVSWEDLGSIAENELIPRSRFGPHECHCEWDGMNEGTASLGLHSLEVRAWETIDNEDDWVWARAIRGVQVN